MTTEFSVYNKLIFVLRYLLLPFPLFYPSSSKWLGAEHIARKEDKNGKRQGKYLNSKHSVEHIAI